MAQFKGVRKLSVKQYNKLKSNGLLDKNILYVTPEKGLSVLQGETAPTTETEGVVGQFYLDITEKKLYQCVSVIETTYEWQEVGGGSGVSQEDFNNLVNNTTQLEADANSNIRIGSAKVWGNPNCVAIGKDATAKANTTVAIGQGAIAGGTGSVAVGRLSETGKTGSISIGSNAKTTELNAIQLGAGTNTTPNTLQIYNDNIYNHETHTLTVQNIQQNGNKVYGVITGFEGTPTYDTAGEVGQIIITQSWDAYICVAYDDVEYTWKKITI